MGLLAAVAKKVDDLVRMGYPESVAERIASGAIDQEQGDSIRKQIQSGYFVRNTEKAPRMDDASRFGQDIEPTGQYFSPVESQRSDLPPNMIGGKKEFKNPLVVDFGGGYQDETNWKKTLSNRYGGKTGEALSDAIRDDGYDAIYTIEQSSRGPYLSEAVDLYAQKGAADPRLLGGIAAASSSPAWLDTANHYAGEALDALEMPYRGLLGLTRLGGGLAAGEGFDSALAQAVRQINQPVEETAMRSGDAVLRKTGSPGAATLANVIIQMANPI